MLLLNSLFIATTFLILEQVELYAIAQPIAIAKGRAPHARLLCIVYVLFSLWGFQWQYFACRGIKRFKVD